MSAAHDTKGKGQIEEDEEENNATVVVDLAMLKKLKGETVDETGNATEVVPDLDFGSDDDATPAAPAASSIPSFTILLFEFGQPLFEASQSLLPSGFKYELIKDVNVLSGKLKGDEFKVVFFNYDGNPKAVNTLSAQIKSKFPNVKTVIFAKNISPDKAAIHKASASGANGYISGAIEAVKVKEQLEIIYKAK